MTHTPWRWSAIEPRAQRFTLSSRTPGTQAASDRRRRLPGLDAPLALDECLLQVELDQYVRDPAPIRMAINLNRLRKSPETGSLELS